MTRWDRADAPPGTVVHHAQILTTRWDATSPGRPTPQGQRRRCRASCVVPPRARRGRRRASAHARHRRSRIGAPPAPSACRANRSGGTAPADTMRRLTRGWEGSPRRGRRGERRPGFHVPSPPSPPSASSSSTRNRGSRSGMSRVTISQTASSSITPYPWIIRFLVSTMPRHGTSWWASRMAPGRLFAASPTISTLRMVAS